ncbi:helix-turn-helix domain-containing protein [Brachybacterium atlanticum]|uniref:helix-turn-helix domain-containing protein n=1 Tax=Brachybacterium atlanticum TaxID=2911888 RepID=UPI0027E50782|nr:helix-turn-helix transcriptional regulator [Brachybacterium atlanticum]
MHRRPTAISSGAQGQYRLALNRPNTHKTPERLNVEVFAALCRILDCTPNDLIEIPPAQAKRARRAGGSPRTEGPAIGSLRPIPAKIHRPTE